MAQNDFGGLEQFAALPSFIVRVGPGVQKPRPDRAMFTSVVANGPSGWIPPMAPTGHVDPVRRVQPIQPSLPVYGRGGMFIARPLIEPRLVANGTGVYIPRARKPTIMLNDGPVVPIPQPAQALLQSLNANMQYAPVGYSNVNVQPPPVFPTRNVNVRGAPQQRAKPRGMNNVRGGGQHNAGPRNERPKNVRAKYVKKKKMEGVIHIGSNNFLPSDWNYNI